MMPRKPFGDGFIGRMVENKLKSVVVEVFGDYDADDLQKYILAETPIVETELEEKHKEKLRRAADSNEDLIREHLHPPLVWDWLSNPEWAPSSTIERELNECADTIRSTPGGKEWLCEQVYTVWDIAGVDRPDEPRTIE